MVTQTGMPKTFFEHKLEKGIQSFFHSLLLRDDKSSLELSLVKYLRSSPLRLRDFPENPASYSRTIVCRLATGFEAMVARWSDTAKTVVHGHPDYAFYYCLAGQLQVEHFEMGAKGPEFVRTSMMNPGDYCCIEGVAGTYENGIHRMSALKESLSFHVYSDDALKGRSFEQYRTVAP